MKRSLTAIFCACSLSASLSAFAAPPLVNPVIINLGGPAVHLTPHIYDSAGNEMLVGGAVCTIIGVPTTLATIVYDATGANLTAVSTGSTNLPASWKCVNGSATVTSAGFTVTVPWSAASVGDTSP